MDPNQYFTPAAKHTVMIIAKRLAQGAKVSREHLLEALDEDTESVSLSQLSRDLTQEAKDGKLDPVIGRDDEIQKLMDILGCRQKNNPVLIGEAGVGKTAIVEGLAQQIIKGSVSEVLKAKRVIALDLAMLVGGTKYRGQLEKRVKTILAEIDKEKGKIVLFIDELHTIVGTGSARGALDLSNMLKPALARGDLHCIGATTFDEYRKYIEPDAALERRFQPVKVEEPSVEDPIAILQGLKETYKDYHKVQIQENAIKEAVKFSKRYISGRFLPDKAVEVFDRAASRVRRTSDSSQKGTVTPEDIAGIVEGLTGIPISQLMEDEVQKLLNMETHLQEQVIGQGEAVSAVSNAIRRSRVGIGDPNRPLGSFLFMGPTGVGKTHLAKLLAAFLFGKANAIVCIDMSEYMEKHTVSRLIGAPPGYVGYDEGGQLTEAVRQHPYCVILLDEMEKAHPEVSNVLLQMLDDGRMTDGQGRTVDFKSAVVIMTSNIGSQWISDTLLEAKEIRCKVMEAVQAHFSPEFLNRIDDLIIFNRLDIEELKQIVTLELTQICDRFEKKEMTLTLSEPAKKKLVERGFDPVYGARSLRRTLDRDILNPLATQILEGKFKEGNSIRVNIKDGEFFFASQV